MQQVSNVSGINLRGVDSPLDERQESFFAKVPMKLETSGQVPPGGEVRLRNGKLDRIINVENIELSQPKVEGDDVVLTAKCLATTFHAVKPKKTRRDPRRRRRNAASGQKCQVKRSAWWLLALVAVAPPLAGNYALLDARLGAKIRLDANASKPVVRNAVGRRRARWRRRREERAEYAESDFVENDRNRDPFRIFTTDLQRGAEGQAFRTSARSLLAQYSIDELKLVAIVQGRRVPARDVRRPARQGVGHQARRLRREGRDGAHRRTNGHRLPGQLARRSRARRRRRAHARGPGAARIARRPRASSRSIPKADEEQAANNPG